MLELLLDELDEDDELLDEVPPVPPQPINAKVVRDNKRPRRPETRVRIMIMTANCYEIGSGIIGYLVTARREPAGKTGNRVCRFSSALDG